MSGRVLLFSLGGESYAADLDPIESILPEPTLFCVPKQPAFFEGFFSHQGECLPVVSLRQLLGSAQAMERTGGKMLVVRHRGFLLAIRVDVVMGTRGLEREKPEGPASENAAIPVEIDGQSVILLSLDRLLSSHVPAEATA